MISGIDCPDIKVVIDRLLSIGLESMHGDSVHTKIGAVLESAASAFENMAPHRAISARLGMLAQLRKLARLIAPSSPWQAEVLMDAHELARASMRMTGGK